MSSRDIPSDSALGVDVLITPELARRPSRAPDYEAESRALGALARELATNPAGVLQKCAELVLELCRADSAGISILEPGGASGIFRWHAAAGAFAANLHGTIPPDASPCGAVIARNEVLLFDGAERVFPALRGIEPRIYENLLAPWRVDGEAVGTLWAMKHTPEGGFDAEDARLLKSLARFAIAAHQTVRALQAAQAAGRQSETRLAAKLADTESLQRLSTQLIPEQQPDALYEQALDAAMELMKADAASLQMLTPDGDRLVRLASRNLHPLSEIYWQLVDASHASPCSRSLRAHERVVVEDVEASASLAGTRDLEELRRSGVRAVQSTPLVARSGRPIGMISTHWREPHRFSGDEFSLFDVLARQLADLIERSQAEAALRESEERYRTLFDAIDEGFAIFDVIFDDVGRPIDFRYVETNAAFEKQTGRRPRPGQTMREVFPEAKGMWLDLYATVARTGQAERFVDFVEGLDRWYDVYVFPTGEPGRNRLAALFSDVTERKRAEDALRDGEARQAFLLKLTDTLRSLVDPAAIKAAAARVLGEHLRVNRAFYAEVEGRDWLVVNAYEQDVEPRAEGRHPMAAFGQWVVDSFRRGQRLIIRHLNADSRFDPSQRAAHEAYRILGAVAVPLVKEGKLVSILVVHSAAPRDWTELEIALVEETAERTWSAVERARAEEALRESEAKFRELFDSIDEGLAIVEMIYDDRDEIVDMIFRQVNRAYERQGGVYDVVGRSVFEVIPGVEDYWINLYKKVAKTGEPAREQNHQRDVDRWFDVYFSRVDENGRFVAIVFNDITERKRAEEALRASEARLRTAFSISTVGVLFWGPESRLTDANDAFLRMSGFSREEALGKTWQDFTPPEFHAVSEKFVEEIEATGEGTPYEKQYFRKDGSRWWGVFAARKIGDGFVEFVLDVTRQHEAQEALRESEERFRRFGEASSDVLWIRDAETLQWEYLSPAFEVIYGVSRDAALQGNTLRRWTELISPEDRDRALDHIRQVRNGERVSFEYRIVRPVDGEVRWVRYTDFPLLDERGRVERIGGVGRDITEEKETADRLQVLVAELQHRTRNLLGVVRSVASQTLAASASLETFRARFNDRLGALSRVQGLLSRAEHEPVTIGALVRMELDALGADVMHGRIRLEGPEVRLRSAMVQTLALALHELATNAWKYGALATEDGRLAVTWRVVPDGIARRLALEWVEEGAAGPGPEPARSGYGRELIERALPYALGAKTRFELDRAGLRCTIDLPLTARGGRDGSS